MNGKGDKNRVKDFKAFNRNFDDINWGSKKNKANPDCPRCFGSGWNFWNELNEYNGPAVQTGQDDTHYLCRLCYPID